MLKQLHIQNYAIIDELKIDFSSHFNAITGETGAGKSILIGALSLILGERADTSVLLDSTKKCYVEGTFSIEDKQEVISFLRESELDSEEELIIRREIAVTGKSRAFVNDTPVNLDQLRHLSAMLVDLHQQFDTLELNQTDFQRDVLDALSNNSSRLANYRTVFFAFAELKKELTNLHELKSQFNREYDYNKFLFDELEETAFKENELEDLDTELKKLSNAEQIKESITKVYYQLSEGENPVVQSLRSSLGQLQPFISYHSMLPSLIQRLQSTQIELADIADELSSMTEGLTHDPGRISEVNDRLSAGYKLLKKHSVKTTTELLALKDQFEDKLRQVLNIDETIAAKESESNHLFQQANDLAMVISENRKKQADILAEKVNKLLVQVGMPNARLKVEIRKAVLSQHGIDEVIYLFDANKKNKFEPLRKVASGGELSRLMLSIKSLVAQTINLPTMIFDEIDTGISGEAAKQVGIIIRSMSENRQVICITHQPQIAGKADTHYYVYKEGTGNTIKTKIRELSVDERITTIAKMLSGEKPTPAAMENAKEMLLH